MSYQNFTGAELRQLVENKKREIRDYQDLIIACTPIYEEMKRRAAAIAKAHNRKISIPTLTSILR